MKYKLGFTLIELLIVVAIIGILAAIAVPNFLNAQMKANISRTYADMRTVSVALEQYMLDWNSYVEDHDWPDTPTQRGLFRLTFPVAYLSTLPIDAFTSKLAKNYSERNQNFELGTGNAFDPAKQWPNQAYIIISAGPNLIEEVDRNDEFPFTTTIKSFDISNGVRSDGDIVRLGGNYNSGYILLDGKIIANGRKN